MLGGGRRAELCRQESSGFDVLSPVLGTVAVNQFERGKPWTVWIWWLALENFHLAVSEEIRHAQGFESSRPV